MRQGKGEGKRRFFARWYTFYKEVTSSKTFRLTTYKAVGLVIAHPTRDAVLLSRMERNMPYIGLSNIT